MTAQTKELFFTKDFTIHSIESFKSTVKDHMSGKHQIEFNFSQVESMDLTGVQCFLSIIKTLKKKNRDFSIAPLLPEPVQDAFYVSGLLLNPKSTVQALEATLQQFLQDGVL